MKILDTLSGKEKEVNLSQKIRIYLCGVTVYDESHIGHARTIIIFDTLRRFLESSGCDVMFVQNFTDVDDKIIDRAQREGVSTGEITTRYIQNYFTDFDSLNIKRATVYPKATEHINDMLNLILNLLEKKIAYESKNGIYFSVSKFPNYGKLSKKNPDDLIAGSRVEVDETKSSPLDFALWKFSESEPNWDSPWGKGRPGWHIECSAMSTKYLGENFEIHGGGRDLVFPHHENEIAQSESFTSKTFAQIWMHAGMITINGEKMSKSVGNIKTVKHVLENWGPNVIRLFCISGHYSKPIDYSENLLQENLVRWRQIETSYYELILAHEDGSLNDLEEFVTQVYEEFNSGFENNFNTPAALSSFFKLIKRINEIAADDALTKTSAEKVLQVIKKMLDVLGLHIPTVTDEEKSAINSLIEKRNELRKQGKFQEADIVRDEISKRNVVLFDHKKRTTWAIKEKIKAEV